MSEGLTGKPGPTRKQEQPKTNKRTKTQTTAIDIPLSALPGPG